MFISVIVCTYGRAAALENLLNSLEVQCHRDFEVLVIDGDGERSPGRDTVKRFLQRPGTRLLVRVIRSERGLTRQRNVGLKAGKGDLVCFLDDDVTLEEDFLARVASLFERPDMQDVGGITGYDPLNYPTPLTLRWRLRRIFGVIPSLKPGDIDHLGRAVPLSFLEPWSGYKEVGWLSGFCMIYRRAAVGDLSFDELLPTYGGEDRDFSIQVGKRWRLLICGDLHVKHHYTSQGRSSDLQRILQSSFGVGRRFAKNARTNCDYITVVHTFLGDFVIDVMAFVNRPLRVNLLTVFVRMQGFFAGLRSCSAAERQIAPRGTHGSS